MQCCNGYVVPCLWVNFHLSRMPILYFRERKKHFEQINCLLQYLIRQLSRGLSKGDLHQHVLGRMINAMRARWIAWTTCMEKSRKFIKTKLLNWDENESPQRVSFEKIRENLKRHDPPVTKNATFALFNSKMMHRWFITETRLRWTHYSWKYFSVCQTKWRNFSKIWGHIDTYILCYMTILF